MSDYNMNEAGQTQANVGLVPSDTKSKQWLEDMAKKKQLAQQEYKQTDPMFWSLDQRKEYDAKEDEMRVYLLKRNFEFYVREAKLIMLELSLRGFPLSEKDTKDINELSFRSV